ncbi:MAG: hypothetical protein KIT24_12795 [Phycisphaeraceae bacterium]|nr:hypothetical protein [Phycisphaeraceae bacterium]
MHDDEAPPPMREAVLDDAAIESLLGDLEVFAQVDEIVIKSGRGMVGDAARATLADVRRLLGERSVRGVQIRYVYDDARWLDTLMVVPEGIRLIRVRHDAFGQTPQQG